MRADLLLCDVIDEVEEYRSRLAEHEAHIDEELTVEATSEVLLSHSNNRLDFVHGQRNHVDII